MKSQVAALAFATAILVGGACMDLPLPSPTATATWRRYTKPGMAMHTSPLPTFKIYLPIVLRNYASSPIQFVSWGGIGSLERVKAAAHIGIDTHRLPVGWPNADGYYDFTNCDRFIQALDEMGMNVIVHFSNHDVPEWFWNEHPDAMMRNHEGEVTRSSPSLWHPVVRETIKHNMGTVLGHLSQANLLKLVDGVEIGIGMEGQLSYEWDAFWAFDAYAVAAYRQFLIERYDGDIQRLNRDWGTNYQSFEQITPPERWDGDNECCVFLDFYRGNLLNAAVEFSQAAETKCDPRIWLWLSHFIRYPERYYAARFPIFYMRHLRSIGCADAVIVSVVPEWQSRGEITALKELGMRVIGEMDMWPTPEQQREQARLAWDLGCDGFFVGVLENLFTEDGKLTPVGLETEQIIKDWLAGRRP